MLETELVTVHGSSSASVGPVSRKTTENAWRNVLSNDGKNVALI